MISLSQTACESMLEGLMELMDGGSIELMSDNRVLAVLKLSSPVGEIIDRTLEFNDIAEEDSALAQGTAVAARFVSVGGIEILSCDVGDENSDAVIKLNTTKIYRGGPVRLKSFRLAIP